MSGFEFGLIPIAIVIGFAVTKILNAWGHVVRHWSSFDKPWMFLSFTGFAMGGMLTHFVGDWAYRDIELHLGRLVLIMLPTLVMVMAISVVVPADSEWPEDLRDHYYRYARKAAGLFGFGIFLSVAPDLLPGASGVPEPWMIGAYLLPLGLMGATLHPAVHIVGHILVWAMLVLQMSSLTTFGTIQ